MEPTHEHKTHYESPRKKGILGMIVILAGLALLLFNTGLVPETCLLYTSPSPRDS